MLKRLMKSNAGAAMTEYIIVLALVAIAAITVVRVFGTRIRTMFDKATTELNAVEVAPAASTVSGGGSSSNSGSNNGVVDAIGNAANAIGNIAN